MIAESKLEVEENKQKQKTVCDWNSLSALISKQEKVKIQLHNWSNMHFENKKPTKKKKDPFKAKLGVINEQSEDTDKKPNNNKTSA